MPIKEVQIEIEGFMSKIIVPSFRFSHFEVNKDLAIIANSNIRLPSISGYFNIRWISE